MSVSGTTAPVYNFDSSPSAATTGASAGTTGGTAARMDEGQDRFLRLLVAQMSNQDPLNPLDNAQVTSQLAQISTVNSIEQLNRTMGGFVSQFSAQQAMQAATLVGRGVLVEGDRMLVRETDDGRVAHGGFELAGAADNVQIEVLDASGEVIDTVALGAAQAGRHPFTYDAGEHEAGAELSFRVMADGQEATTYSVGFVDAVSFSGSQIALELGWLGSRPYSDARTFL